MIDDVDRANSGDRALHVWLAAEIELQVEGWPPGGVDEQAQSLEVSPPSEVHWPPSGLPAGGRG
jgi:hypothetical protein